MPWRALWGQVLDRRSDHMSFDAHGQPVSGGQLQPGAALYTRRNAELVV